MQLDNLKLSKKGREELETQLYFCTLLTKLMQDSVVVFIEIPL